MGSRRNVVVTGAAGGIGTAIVERFVANGDLVLASDVSAEALASWQPERSQPDSVRVAAADVSDERDVTRLAEFARESMGHVDVVVNCAGYFPIVPFDELTVAQWRRVIDINLTGPYLVSMALLPLVRQSVAGRFIHFGSSSVYEGVPDHVHYTSAKAGVVGFSRTLARAIGPDRITSNVVTPGLTITDVVASEFPSEVVAQQRAARALPRDEYAEDLVGTVFFLASSDAAFVTGQEINVDGGKHMR